jgi:hypothetical protein
MSDIFLPQQATPAEFFAPFTALIKTMIGGFFDILSRTNRNHFFAASVQGCQMVYFQTKNSNLGKFWRVLQWNMLVFYGHAFYFTATRHILRRFSIFCGNLFPVLVYCAKKNLATLRRWRQSEKKVQGFV